MPNNDVSSAAVALDLIHVSIQGIDGEDCVEGYYATAQWNDAHCSDLKAWVGGAGEGETCLFTRLEQSSLVPVGFLTAQFLKKTYLIKPFCFLEENWMVLVFTAFREERGNIGKLGG